jgi:hypothetical protein
MWIEVTGQHETVFTLLALAILVWLTVDVLRSGRLDGRRMALLGAGWGIGMHASPVLILPLIVMLVGGPLFLVPAGVRTRRAILPFVAGFLVAVTPWSIRNVRALGAFAFIRDNFGMELAVSNSDEAKPDMRDNMKLGGTMRRHPYFSSRAALDMRHAGELPYYDSLQVTAVEWITKNPGRFAVLTLRRVALFFVPKLGWEHHAWFYFPVVLLWLAGSIYAFATHRGIVIVLNAVLLAFAGPHFLVQSSPRYSYPVLWIMVLFAVHFGYAVIRHSRDRWTAWRAMRAPASTG